MSDKFRFQVLEELGRAQRDHGREYHSDHEAYGVLLEEVDELWELVRKKRQHRDRRSMLHELVQVAAVAEKWAEAIERKIEMTTEVKDFLAQQREESDPLHSMLLLVGVEVDEATIREWQPIQREEVRLWASAHHLAASDNDDVEIPTRPSFLPPRTPGGE